MSDDSPARLSDRYELLFKLASGGMGSVFVGRARGALGFRQLVAIKLPHPHVLEDPNVRTVLVNEARVASSIRHANVVSVRDVEVAGEQVLLVMDYVEGGALSELMATTKGELDPRLSLRIVLDACAGLQAAHEATDDRGRALDVVHRDVSPQNILVGLDGLARVTDFGVAKCIAEREASSGGGVKGKLAYMAPEYLRGAQVTKQIDVFGLGVVLWELLAGERLFRASNDGDTLDRVLHAEARPLGISAELDAVLACALAKDPAHRFESAEALGEALTHAAGARAASHREVGAFVRALFAAKLEKVRERVARMPSAMGAALAVAPGALGRSPESEGGLADPLRTASLAREPRAALPDERTAAAPMTPPSSVRALELEAPSSLGATVPMVNAPRRASSPALEATERGRTSLGAPRPDPVAASAPVLEGTETVLGSDIEPIAGLPRSRKVPWPVAVGLAAAATVAVSLAVAPRLLSRSAPATVEPALAVPHDEGPAASASVEPASAPPPVAAPSAVVEGPRNAGSPAAASPGARSMPRPAASPKEAPRHAGGPTAAGTTTAAGTPPAPPTPAPPTPAPPTRAPPASASPSASPRRNPYLTP